MPLFSIPLSGLTASSTAMSAIANNQAATNLANAEVARNAALQATASIGNLSLFNYLGTRSNG